MLKRIETDFVSYVWKAAARVGRSAPRITNDIIERLFPETCNAAEREGAYKMFRQGVVNAVKTQIRGQAPDETQIDFMSIDPSFHSLASVLKSHAYHVPSLECQVPVHELIADPTMLNEARIFMRQKGEECLEEAVRLDSLYMAVLANPLHPSPKTRRKRRGKSVSERLRI